MSTTIVREGKKETPRHLLELVVVDDVLIGGAALRERVQLVHVVHIAPERAETRLKNKRYLLYYICHMRQLFNNLIF